MEPSQRLESIANALSIPGAERHIFLCADQSNPRCAPVEVTNALWRHLKARLREAGATTAPPKWQGDLEAPAAPAPEGDGTVLRTKADCLRICEQGAIAVVYPDGTWYAGLDADKLDRVIDEHLLGGRPVEALAFVAPPS